MWILLKTGNEENMAVFFPRTCGRPVGSWLKLNGLTNIYIYAINFFNMSPTLVYCVRLGLGSSRSRNPPA